MQMSDDTFQDEMDDLLQKLDVANSEEERLVGEEIEAIKLAYIEEFGIPLASKRLDLPNL